MNYSALIQNRRSVREFIKKEVCDETLGAIREYHDKSVKRLIPSIRTQLMIFGTGSREALEGAAGYSSYLVGAPNYLVLLSENAEHAGLNAGFIMEDLLLKVADMGMDSCWLTFGDGEKVKQALNIGSELSVAAILAFGYGVKTTRRLRFNILSMSNVDIAAKRRYTDPKRSIGDMVFMNMWRSSEGLDEYIGFYDDMLWEALYAATLAPSYLNRQAYGFLINSGCIALVARPDEYTTAIDGELSLGVVMHHFTSVASGWAPQLEWKFSCECAPALPEGHRVVACCSL